MPAKSFIPGVGFPARLDRVLAEKNLTYREASEKTGISTTTLSNWRQRRNYPEQRRFIRFCSKLSINPKMLLRLPNENPIQLQSPIEKRFKPVLHVVKQITGEVEGMHPEDRAILANLLYPLLESLRQCLITSSTTGQETSSSSSESPPTDLAPP